MKSYRRQAGFSLIELLVVIGVVSVTMSFALPAASRARRLAQAVKCRDQLRQIGVALSAYAGTHEQWLVPQAALRVPVSLEWPELIFNEPQPQVVVCPARGSQEYQERLSYQINYWLRFNGLKWVSKNHVPASQVVLIGESPPGHERSYSVAVYEISWDPVRHGPGLNSNYLWLDLHVSNDVPVSPVGSPDPWKPY